MLYEVITNIALFYLVRERGIFNLGGIARIIFILLQPLIFYLLLRLQPDLFQYLSHQFIALPTLQNLPLSQPVLLINSLVLLLFFTGSVFSRSPIGRGFFWALTTTLLALIAKYYGQSPILYFCAAEFIIIISVIEAAYVV